MAREYRQSPEFKARQAAYYRKWREENAQRKAESDRAYRQTEAYKAKRKAKRATPEYKAKFNEYARERYAAKPEVREKHRDYYETNKDKWRLRAVEQRDKINTDRRGRYQADPAQRAIINERNRMLHQKRDKAARNAKFKRDRDAEYALLAGRPRPITCDVCGEGGAIVFDHCHQRGHFRGWLCQGCNKILGFAKDDPRRLRQLIVYLERTTENTSPQHALPGI